VKAFVLLFAGLLAATANELDSLCADRAAIERVYHSHRIGNRESFEQRFPPSTIAKVISLDLKKEALLKSRYGVEITDELIEREVKRIDLTTRAPEVLRELRKALDDDPARFARAVAKPLMVERELRARFENDDKLHASRREEAGGARREILNAQARSAKVQDLVSLLRKKGSVEETTWQLDSQETLTITSNASALALQTHTNVSGTGGVYAIDASARLAMVSPVEK